MATENTNPLTGLFREIRALLRQSREKHCPPLSADDVVGLAVNKVAYEVFARRLPNGPLATKDLRRVEAEGLVAVLTADPVLGAETFMPAGASQQEVWSAYDRWDAEVLLPALEKSVRDGCQADPRTREGLIFINWVQSRTHSFIRLKNPAPSTWYLSEVLADNVGESAIPPGTDLRRDGHWLYYLPELGGAGVYEFDGSGIRLNSKCIRSCLAGRFGRGLKGAHKSIKNVGDFPQAPVDMMEIRDLRDQLDEHWLLRELLDAITQVSERSPDFGYYRAQLDRLQELVDLLASIQEPALRAAVVYEWPKAGRSRQHGGWSRERVARAYGVSARQVEAREEMARVQLGRLRA